MKKKVLGLMLAICLILPCAFMLSACDDGITDCAYVQYIPQGDEVVRLTSYSQNFEHIYVFANESAVPNPDNYDQSSDYRNACDYACILSIQFSRNLGIDTIDEKQVITADIDGYYYMQVLIKASNYSQTKKVYLNGTAIEHTSKTEGTMITILNFQDFGLIKGNTSNQINTIEYK